MLNRIILEQSVGLMCSLYFYDHTHVGFENFLCQKDQHCLSKDLQCIRGLKDLTKQNRHDHTF